MIKIIPIAVISGLAMGLIAQFAWKMIYFPEPLIPVIIELLFIIGVAVLAIWIIATKWRY